MKKHRHDNWLSILLCIILPTLILVKFSTESTLGPNWGLIVALLFPLGYGLYEYKQTGKFNVFSLIGILSVLLTGGIGLLKLDIKYIAIKEAGVPLIIGLLILLLKNKYPFVKNLLNEVINTELLYKKLEEKRLVQTYEKRLQIGTYLVVASFLLSSVLNFTLAKILIHSQPGTAAFNAELGRMTALSYPAIAVPSTLVMMIAMIYIIMSASKLSELTLEDLLNKNN